MPTFSVVCCFNETLLAADCSFMGASVFASQQVAVSVTAEAVRMQYWA